jgi:hypothetical protein
MLSLLLGNIPTRCAEAAKTKKEPQIDTSFFSFLWCSFVGQKISMFSDKYKVVTIIIAMLFCPEVKGKRKYFFKVFSFFLL